MPPIPAILTWSAAREKNAAKVEQNGIFLRQDKPVATPTRFCSAIKHSIKLSGNLFFKVIAKVEFLVSPSSPTTFLLDSRALSNPLPYAFRVEILLPYGYSGLTLIVPFSSWGSSPSGAKVLN